MKTPTERPGQRLRRTAPDCGPRKAAKKVINSGEGRKSRPNPRGGGHLNAQRLEFMPLPFGGRLKETP